MYDALALFHITRELKRLEGGGVSKIAMPAPTDVFLTIKKRDETKTLFFSCNPSAPRVFLCDDRRDSPGAPYAFLMHLRKRISGAYIEKIESVKHERVVKIHLSSKAQLFTEEKYVLYLEIMGKYSNIILVDGEGKITESAIHVSADTSSKRLVLPGLAYSLPPKQEGKITIDDEKEFFEIMRGYDGKESAHNYMLKHFCGFAPLSLKEAVAESGFGKGGDEEISGLLPTLRGFFERSEPCIVKNGNEITDFLPFPYKLCPDFETKSSLSDAAREYFSQKLEIGVESAKKNRLAAVIKGAKSRNEKNIGSLRSRIEDAKDAEDLKKYGELITANIYKIRRGMENITVYDYYTDSNITIALDPTLEPAQNAQKYYKKYGKKKRALETSESLLAAAYDTADYLESLSLALSTAPGDGELNDLKREMEKTGLIKVNNSKKPSREQTKPRKFTVDGYVVYIGKNNLQNDALVKSSDGGYTWLHTQKIHGSHAVICGKNLALSTIRKVAAYAAFYSKASMSDNVPVDYTLVKYVKKPAGALPGKVIYTNQQTVYVKPENPEK